jgi:competence protein ComEA
MGAAVLGLVALVVVGWRLGGAEGGQEYAFEEEGGAGDDARSAPGAPETADVPGPLWVHVAGAVAQPGLYELRAGARVGDALAAAGGARPDAAVDGVNLAQPLTDGEQVHVPTAEEYATGAGGMPAPGESSGQGGGVAGGRVDINRASAAELEALPGVGPATAKKILADREANGPFSTPEDLMRVSGIGEKKFEAMRDLVIVR